MSETMQVSVPNIGDFDEVEVIEVLVNEGDTIAAEQSLITVESDKASMEIPSSTAGVVTRLLVKLGDKVSEGTPIVELRAQAAQASDAARQPGAPQAAPAPAAAQAAVPRDEPAATAQARTGLPESASSMTPPATAPVSGARVQAAPQEPSPAQVERDSARSAYAEPPPRAAAQEPSLSHGEPSPTAGFDYDRTHVVKPHASPSVRKFARELGVDLTQVRGSGPKERILHDDVRNWVKAAVAQGAAPRAEGDAAGAGAATGAVLGLLPWPKVDFEKFGPVKTKPVGRIRKIAAGNLHRNWVTIPHVTNHDDADVTDLEAFRQQLNREHERDGTKVTLLAFLIKACVAVLKEFPDFNSSLDGENLVVKDYWHIGFAADTPNGLVVPVIRDADRKGILQIARETAELAAKAREGKLLPGEMQGGTFSISSLGGIGGTYFTPIINAPEVAILGVCRSAMRPTWNGKGFEPRLILPLSLSWDHRVVDGASAARFNTRLAQLLADFRRVLL
ncbi:MAG: dihydrolipoyllysine-residue acetyltransferase [Burkholderiaceae bacterium]|nr:dihydrolipoyllysine-residue acetyltransferase [Burkholderiaceae bacterium]